MSTPQPPTLAKLIVGFFTKDKGLIESLEKELTSEVGEVVNRSPWLPFDYTDYYESEMGTPLFRRMLVFKGLIEQADLAGIKIATNNIEKRFADNDKRNVNIDPGYMLPERFVLATGKNFTHRIYLEQGIYADLTLIYQKGGFVKLPWTYPDYADERMLDFLKEVREKYMVELKSTYKGE